MTITIPTGELIGLLGDVLPFAFTDDDLPDINAVRLHWDGSMLHAQATDRFRIGWSSWHPDDDPDVDYQEDIFAPLGGADDPWTATLPLAAAQETVQVFKLSKKLAHILLTVDHDAENGRLTIRRDRTAGMSALRLVHDVPLLNFPDVSRTLAEHNEVKPVAGIAFTAKYLADFSRVRARGPLTLSFAGQSGLTHVAIGKRFTGAIAPVREERDEVAA